MTDYLTIIATIIYFFLFLTIVGTTFIYYIVYQYSKNIMLWATFILLAAISLEFFIIFFVKTLSLIGAANLFHPYRNYAYVPIRTIILIAAIYFLKTSVRKIDRQKANKSV